MLSLLLSLLIAAVSPQLSFTRYTAREGFPQQPVSGIAQDSKGHILISADNLYSFDGYNIKKQDSRFISSIYPLSGGRVAVVSNSKAGILSEGGIADSLAFESAIRSVVETSDGKIWFIFNERIVSKGPEGEREWRMPFEDVVLCATASVGKIYLGTASGSLVCFDPISSMFTREVFSKSRINCLQLTRSGGLFIGTSEDGLYCKPSGGGALIHYLDGLCSSCVLSLCEDMDGILWAGTLKGLNLITDGKVIGSYRNESDNETSLSHNTIRRIFCDSQGGMWLGTFFGGINYWHPSRRSVFNLTPGTSSGALNDVVASCMAESSDGLIWIGTNQGGINCYDPSTGRVVNRYLFSNSKTYNVRSNDIKAIYHHPDGIRVYVGIHNNGLNVINRKTGKISHLSSPGSVIGIEPIDDNRLLLLSYNSIYSIYEIGRDRCESVREGSALILFRSSAGEYSASDSLKRLTFSEEGKIIFGEPSVPVKRVVDVCESLDSSSLYVASKYDLFKYDSGKKTSERIELPEDFPDIVGLAVDPDGDLWITTSLGLYCHINGRFLYFSRAKGLVTDFYSQYSRLRSSSGMMYFGGVGGVSILDPVKLKRSEPCPRPEVSSVYVSGRKQPVPNEGACVLRHPDRSVSISFSVPDFAAAGTNVFEYRLEGLDSDWRRAGLERKAEYTRLPRGQYVFKVRASRQGDVWTTNERALEIRVFPAWYATAGAIVVWVLLFSFVLFYYILLLFKQREAENKLALLDMEKRYSREISKLKVLRILNSTVPEGSKPVKDLSAYDERFLSRAMNIIEMNINNPDFSTDDLAVGLALSRSSLHKYMKSATGDSALAFIHKIRFSRACELLEKKDLTISEICYKTGFSSPAYFSASFRKYMGCSPQEYQKRFS